MVKPRKMSRPLAVTGTTVHTEITEQIKCKMIKCYGALEIYIYDDDDDVGLYRHNRNHRHHHHR